MKHLLFLALFFSSLLFGEVEHRYTDQKLIDSGIKIIDIRTPGEWKNTGIVKGSIPIMFFDESGKYDLEKFMNELRAKVDTKKKFAIICNSGNRTRQLSDYLSKSYGFDVINLKGGIRYAIGKNLPLEPYLAEE